MKQIEELVNSTLLSRKQKDELIESLLILFNVNNRLNEDTLEEINAIMWESYMIKGRNFGRQEGFKIMQELVKWSKR